MHPAPSRAGTLTLIGGDLALDFTNTASGRNTPDHQDHLRTTEDLIAWARHARVLPPADADRLAANPPAPLLPSALALRDAVHTIATAYAAHQPAPPAALTHLARAHTDCLAEATLAPNGPAYAWSWAPSRTPTSAILGPIALSALALITQSDTARIKQCEGRSCGWLFFDSTKNRSRRWCEMSVCGNRAKLRRHRDKASKARALPSTRKGPAAL